MVLCSPRDLLAGQPWSHHRPVQISQGPRATARWNPASLGASKSRGFCFTHSTYPTVSSWKMCQLSLSSLHVPYTVPGTASPAVTPATWQTPSHPSHPSFKSSVPRDFHDHHCSPSPAPYSGSPLHIAVDDSLALAFPFWTLTSVRLSRCLVLLTVWSVFSVHIVPAMQ